MSICRKLDAATYTSYIHISYAFVRGYDWILYYVSLSYYFVCFQSLLAFAIKFSATIM